MSAPQTPSPQQPSPQQAQAAQPKPEPEKAKSAQLHPHARPKNDPPPETGTWLKLDIGDPEAEAAERAYLKESARVRRGVWIGNFVAGTVVAAVVVALGYVFLPRLGKPAGLSAAEVVGTDEQRRDAAALVSQLSGQVTMWKLQHYDRLPDFGRFAGWEQFTQATNVNGELFARDPRGGTQMCGPYLTAKPVNPINGRSNVYVTDADVPPGAEVPGEPVGFVFSTMKLRFFVTDVAGTKVIDPTARPELETVMTPAAAAKDRDAKAATFAAMLHQFKAQLSLYRLQHNDELPDFEQYPGWEQLIGKTDATGKPSADGQYGPYMDKPLKNPYTGTARVQVVSKAPGIRFRPASETVAYVLDTKSAKIWGVDAEGKLSTGETSGSGTASGAAAEPTKVVVPPPQFKPLPKGPAVPTAAEPAAKAPAKVAAPAPAPAPAKAPAKSPARK